MDWLKDKIKQKEKELQGLKKQFEEKETEKYKHYIGRYFELAATTIFRVDKIEYITSDRIECEGLRITGDIRYSNDFSINIMGSGSLFIDYSNNEITKEKFIEIMNSWIDEQKKNVLAHLL